MSYLGLISSYARGGGVNARLEIRSRKGALLLRIASLQSEAFVNSVSPLFPVRALDPSSHGSPVLSFHLSNNAVSLGDFVDGSLFLFDGDPRECSKPEFPTARCLGAPHPHGRRLRLRCRLSLHTNREANPSVFHRHGVGAFPEVEGVQWDQPLGESQFPRPALFHPTTFQSFMGADFTQQLFLAVGF